MPEAPKYRKSATLHRQYRNSIATNRKSASLHKKYRIEISMAGGWPEGAIGSKV